MTLGSGLFGRTEKDKKKVLLYFILITFVFYVLWISENIAGMIL